jgi:hypothetical protein
MNEKGLVEQQDRANCPDLTDFGMSSREAGHAVIRKLKSAHTSESDLIPLMNSTNLLDLLAN